LKEQLKALGYTQKYSETHNNFYYELEDVKIWDTLNGFMYMDTGIQITSIGQLERLNIEFFGE